MVIGDVTQKKLLAKALTTTNTDSSITGAVSKVTTITSITLVNLGATARTVTIYGYGTAAGNTIATIPVAAAPGTEMLTGLDYVLAAGELYYFKQDTGTDVNVTVMGIEEVVS